MLGSATLAVAQTVPPVSTSPTSIDAFPDWLKTVGIFSGLTSGPGVLVWYLWYSMTKLLPRMEKRYEDRMSAMEERHAEHWALQNVTYRQDLQGMHKEWREDQQSLRVSLDRLSDAIDDRKNDARSKG
jgi:DNA-binding transcriptional MocR family regulator